MQSFNPLQYPLCLRFPARVAPSQWSEHVPFAMFLVEAMRPRSVVELGAHNGVSYCAFCQAIRAASVDARAFAIDTWEGDSHTGAYADDILADLKRHHDPLYRDFSSLIQSTFDEALEHFADESVDLLHIDGYHTYKAVRHDFDTWLPKVVPGGIVLLHDINVHDRDFGAWMLWEEVSTRYPSFCFTHQHGLGVIVKSSALPAVLQPLAGSDADAVQLRDFFAQLGGRISSRIEKDQVVSELTTLVRNKEREILDNWDRRGREIHQLWVLREQENQLFWLQIAGKDQELEALRVRLSELGKMIEAPVAVKELRTPSILQPAKRVKKAWSGFETKALRAYQIWQEQGSRVLFRKIRRRMFRRRRADPVIADLQVVCEGVPTVWQVGNGNTLPVSGSCYHPIQRIKRLEIVAAGGAFPVKVSHMNRPDLYQTLHPDPDQRGHSLQSGFCALVPITPVANTSLHLAVRAHLSDGTTTMKAIADVALESDQPESAPSQLTNEASIAICMTTYNPSPALFERQIRSIQEQTNQDWLCIICDDCSDPNEFEMINRTVGDDSRFVVHRNTERLGFYRNFENCLRKVPPGAKFVTLSDHDDYWYPTKLKDLLPEFDDETTLVYSDMRIVDEAGKRLADTYWVHRRNNYTSLASLFLANTITGAASMFRRALLDHLLPFPVPIGGAFHDHWIGCTALALGHIKYVDRPLYNYVQHRENVLGFQQAPRRVGLRTLARMVQVFSPVRIRTRWQAWKARAKAIYMNDVLRLEQIAQTLDLRCGDQIDPNKRRTLRRIARLDESYLSIPWLIARSLFGFRTSSVTMGAENGILRALFWKWTMGCIARLRSMKNGAPMVQAETLPAAPAAMAAPQADAFAAALERVDSIEQKVAPLRLQPTEATPRRINLLIPTIDFNYVFGGYITKFQLALRLAAEGHRVRILLVDYTDYQPTRWRKQLQAYPGLENLLDRVEIVCAFDRSRPVECHPNDAFLATTWWTAHVAHRAVCDLGRTHFTYLIQEFETYTFPMGTYAALADESYTFPHYAVFSTELLRDHFRQNRLGVFAQDLQAGAANSNAFENAITAVGKITAAELANRRVRKLLFYARPESHASRNMFEMGLAALRKAVAAGHFVGDWEFNGIGTVSSCGAVSLGNATLHLLPRQGPDCYQEVLRTHDIGLSLMYTPHPSLVPIEMASAGMLTVTNTCGNKSVDSMTRISPNLIAVSPSVDSIEMGLKRAIANLANYDARARGAEVKWSTTWDDAFNADVMGRIQEFLSRTSGDDSVFMRAA